MKSALSSGNKLVSGAKSIVGKDFKKKAEAKYNAASDSVKQHVKKMYNSKEVSAMGKKLMEAQKRLKNVKKPPKTA